MRAKRLGPADPAIREPNAVILFRVGPYRLGIDARALKEIRNVRGLAAKDFEGIATLSAHDFLGVPPGPGERVLVLRQGRVALRVDRVERMVEASVVRPLPRAFQGAEREWYRGFAMAGDMVFPLLNPDMLERVSQLPVPQMLPSGGVEEGSLGEGGASWV